MWIGVVKIPPHSKIAVVEIYPAGQMPVRESPQHLNYEHSIADVVRVILGASERSSEPIKKLLQCLEIERS